MCGPTSGHGYPASSLSQPELGGGVVGPGLLDAGVAECREAYLDGLVDRRGLHRLGMDLDVIILLVW